MKNLQSSSLTESSAPNSALGEDRALWQDFQAGDRLAFEALYQHHIQLLIAYGRNITTDRNLIQDCIQDLFVELWESRQTIAYPQSVRYYLLKALRYKIVRQIRIHQPDILEESRFPVEYDNAESRWLLSETSDRNSQQLNLALGQLPKRQKEAIYLRYFEELSNEEVAQVMGVNYQSACKFIYTALKNLRERMQLSALIPLLTAFFAFS